MVEPNQLKQAKEIIAYLKEQKENEESAQTKLGNHLLISPIDTCVQYADALHISQKSCDNFQHNTNDKSVSDKSDEIRNIIRNLKETKEQKFKFDEAISNLNTIQSDNFTNSYTKKVNENGDINKSENYSPKPNKRFKSNHINSSKQSHLTEFYNVVKFVGDHDDKYSCESCISKCVGNIKCKNHIEKGQSFPTVLISNTNIDFNEDRTVFHTSIQKVNEYVPPLQGNDPKSRKKRVWDIFHNIKKTNFLSVTNTNREKIATNKLKQVNRADTQKKNYPNETAYKNTYTRTVDDFCNNVMTLTKSLSAGNIISEKENIKDTDSIPLTRCELRKVEKRLEGNTTFDDFIEKVLKNINNENSKSIIDNTEVGCNHSQANYLKVGTEENTSNKLEKYNEETNVPISVSNNSSCENKSQILQFEQKLQNSELAPSVTVIDENIKLCSEINFSALNEDSDQQKNCKSYFEDTSQDIDLYCSQFTQKYIGSKKDESTSQINRLDLISEKDNHMIEDKYITVEKECNIEDLYNCVDTNCSQNEINSENALETEINLLNNDLEKSILTAAYRQKKISEKSDENVDSFKLENFLENILSSIDKKEYKNNECHKCKFRVKRYRKGKTKIYKLKKLKKRSRRGQTEDDEDLTFNDLLKKITIDGCESQPRLSRFKSGSSISTSSSYVPDDTKSDVLSTGSIELKSPQQRLRHGFNELSKDKSLRYSGNEWEDIPDHDKDAIKMKIQNIFFQILEDFKNKRYSYLRHRRQSFDNCIFKDGRLQFKPRTESSMTIISSGAQRSKAKFQLMLYILKKIQTLLETDTKLTKRELYYQLKELISDQRVSDRAINAISCLLDVGMWALNIIAQKGLVFGDLKLLLSSGEMLNCNIPGTLIPQDINDIVEVHSTAYFILVVEKESIFHKLIEEDLPNKLTRPFIMITGKGFPDLNTQLFLRKLWMVMSIPVFILVDADPHGINIMLNYRFGSVNNAHVSRHLAVPKAKWLGIYPSEIINLNIARQPLNKREIKLVNHMLGTPYMEFSSKLIDELTVLLTKKFKAGIEGLIKTDNYLSEVYLPNKFFTHNFI